MGKLETLNGSAVRPLGLAGNPETQSEFATVAHRAGVNYFFFYNLSFSGMVEGLKPLLKTHRDSVVVATGSESRDPAEMRSVLDRTRRQLGVDAVDVFFAEYVSPSDDLKQVVGSTLEEIWSWKAEEKVRYVGATTHSRPLALSLVESGRIEVLMHRYNMAHRGAEERVLPAAQAAGIPVVAFTCTRWGSLLAGHSGWNGPVPSAADCYRYVLHHPAVHLALTAPGAVKHLEENLAMLEDARPPDTETVKQWEAYGGLVYGQGTDAFDTRWP